ncbi:hypothetical protein CR103_21300 [Massilia psychrophila]|uniref:Uncharacterized protein n=2 Tax=Massilia psychrophila TaxID=1603353 RepID=A0A2G8SVN5_9BURK|nr:hypothetical protein CR103_21300 [Massilia psychrophila]GGE92593.1 hypothetical protein GCM10008020_42030 [Massilia psychrophila]
MINHTTKMVVRAPHAASKTALQAIYSPPTRYEQPFTGFRIAATDRAESVVAEVVSLLLRYEQHRAPRKRKRKTGDFQTFERQVEALVCDLIHSELARPDGWLAIELSNTALGSRDRYKSIAISKTLKDVLGYMATPEMELVKHRRGVWVPSDPSLSMLSTIRAGERLRNLIQDRQLTCADFTLDNSQETIVLKDTKADHNDAGSWLQYDDTDQTHKYRSDMAFINDALAEADIQYRPCPTDGQVVDTADRHLRRYFNNGSFQKGGRLFGGFWLNMSKMNRRGILIQGVPTVTLDFGQMNPRILYGLAGEKFNAEDAYTIPRLEEYRDGVKVVFNSMLHRTSPMKKKPRGSAELFPGHVRIKEITSGIIIFHKPIADLFYKGIGLDLLYKESQILVEVLTELLRLGITALPVHDAVIVAEHHQDQATTIMLAVFKKQTNIDGVVKVDA